MLEKGNTVYNILINKVIEGSYSTAHALMIGISVNTF